ncbi:MAG: sodium:solute symporter family protein, partial [Burkholderiales bacterium]|nr:sodium:solute symporter family protein [Burkholderiales bacterium]
QTMSFLNTWLPGTIFIVFAGFFAGGGVIGFYVTAYSLMAVMFMFFIAQPVHDWGRRFDLRTQADFVGMRYGSKAVRIVAAVIGVVSMFPWLVLGLQSLGLVFSYLSFGVVSPVEAVFVGIAVLGLRQIWTVRMGMRGVVISDMVQGIVAYGVGGLVALGLLVGLLGEGHGLAALPPAFYALPGIGSEAGPMYYFSIVATGALGAWCWPDIFVRLFTARSTATIKRSSLQAATILFLFINLLGLMAMVAHSLPEVAAAPDRVWFIVAERAGVLVLSIAGVAVLAATMGNISALTAALGTQVAQDVVHVGGGAPDATVTRTAKTAVVGATLLGVAGAVATVNVTSGLLTLALTSYQGIVQLAPALFLGLIWRRGNAAAAIAGMVSGFAVAAVLQLEYPLSIPWAWGLTSGVVGMAVNAVLYVLVSVMAPVSAQERGRVDELFDSLHPAAAGAAPAQRGGLRAA